MNQNGEFEATGDAIIESLERNWQEVRRNGIVSSVIVEPSALILSVRDETWDGIKSGRLQRTDTPPEHHYVYEDV